MVAFLRNGCRLVVMLATHVVVIWSSIPSHHRGLSPEANIAAEIKKTLFHKSTDDVTNMMKRHLVQMKLISKDNVWANQQLQNIGSNLLPRNLNGQHLAFLVDKIAENAEKNPYLHNFLSQAQGPDFSRIIRQARLEGGNIFPDVAAYAMVLELLNLGMKEDWRVLEACHDVWTRELSKKELFENTDLFSLAKTVSVKITIELSFKLLSGHNYNKTYYSNLFRYGLYLNILEACAEEIRLGYLDNAKVGWTLAMNGPNNSETTLSQDGKTIEYHMPLGKEWADLYQTWNMAFCSHFKEFPYFMSKLLIPSVSGYQKAPEDYMPSRINALYTHINWVLQGRVEGTLVRMNWATREVTTNWGRINNKSRKRYEFLHVMIN